MCRHHATRPTGRSRAHAGDHPLRSACVPLVTTRDGRPPSAVLPPRLCGSQPVRHHAERHPTRKGEHQQTQKYLDRMRIP